MTNATCDWYKTKPVRASSGSEAAGTISESVTAAKVSMGPYQEAISEHGGETHSP